MPGTLQSVDGGYGTEAAIVERVRHWLERIVVGLDLCPFAHLPYRSDRIRYRVSAATSVAHLFDHLADEALRLQQSDPAECETTLLIHPWVLTAFPDYNDALATADAVLADLGLEGDLQVASFHPDYRFADSEPDDPANCSNRSPFPLLHLLREASISRVLDQGADPEAICRRNIATLRVLGLDGLRQKLLGDPD